MIDLKRFAFMSFQIFSYVSHMPASLNALAGSFLLGLFACSVNHLPDDCCLHGV